MAVRIRLDSGSVAEFDTVIEAMDWQTFCRAHERKGEGSPYDTGPAPTVTARAEGGYVVEENGAELGTADSVHPDALRLVEGTQWFTAALERKQADKLSGGKLAAGRWFHAARHEDTPAVQGGQLTREAIDEIVRNLAGIRKAPIVDGGDMASAPHGSVPDPGNTPASGFVLAGVRVTDADGSSNLWLYCRLHAEVDAKIDEREFVYGSVAWIDDAVFPFVDDDGKTIEIGSRLISYALTSEPLQEGLEPHPARSGFAASMGPTGVEVAKLTAAIPFLTAADVAMQRPHVTAYARSAIQKRRLTINYNAPLSEQEMGRMSRRQPMDVNTKRVRGPVKDALLDLAKTLGVEVPADLTPEAVGQLMAAIGAAAEGEAALEMVGSEPPETQTETPPDTQTETPPPARAVEGLEGDAIDAFVTQVLAWGRDVFGAPDATPAQVLELMAAATDAVKSAVSGEAPAADNAADGGQPAEANAQTDEQARTLRAEVFGLKRAAITRDAAVAKLEAENAELRGVKDAADVDELIDTKFRAAKIAPPEGDARKELRELALEEPDPTKRAKLIDTTLKQVNRPPMGVRTAPTAKTPKGGAPLTEQDAFEAAKAAVLERNPKLEGRALYEAAKQQMYQPPKTSGAVA